jgi:peptidoglycan/xylan/chitin deacetylase (PgdA/CDA1 family)
MTSPQKRRATVVLSATVALALFGLSALASTGLPRRLLLASVRCPLGVCSLRRGSLSDDHVVPPGSAVPAGSSGEPTLAVPSDRAWWTAALAVHHRPAPITLSLAVDSGIHPSVAVFVYHQVAPAGWPLQNGPDSITPQRLAAEFAFFRSRHVATLTPAQFIAFVEGRRRAAEGSVFLTFDNGLEGVYRYAYPLARRYHMHITVFLVGDRVRDVWRPGDRFLAWDQVRQMVKSGVVGVESETYDLHSGEAIAPGRYGPDVEVGWDRFPQGHEEALANYLHRLRYAFVEQRVVFWRHLHTTPTLLVWPFSTYDLVAELEARAAGYKAAFAVYPGVVTPRPGSNLFALPRNPATFMWNNVPLEYDAIYSRYILATRHRMLVASTGPTPGMPGLGGLGQA